MNGIDLCYINKKMKKNLDKYSQLVSVSNNICLFHFNLFISVKVVSIFFVPWKLVQNVTSPKYVPKDEWNVP